MSQTIEDSKFNPTEENTSCVATQMVVTEKTMETPSYGRSVRAYEINQNKIEIPAHDGILKNTGELLNSENERITIFPIEKVKNLFARIIEKIIGFGKDRD